jgi:hypothetical protein
MAVFKTDDFSLVDYADQTKELRFDTSALTTGTIRTLVVSNLFSGTSMTIAVSDSAQLFSAGQQFQTTIGIKDAATGFFINYDCINNVSANRALTPPDMSGTIVARLSVNQTGKTAAIGATNIQSGMVAGYWVVDYTLEVTTGDVTAGTIQAQISYTDDIGATTQTGAALALTATGRDRGSFQAYLASGNITYQTNLVGIIGAAVYTLRLRASYLG